MDNGTRLLLAEGLMLPDDARPLSAPGSGTCDTWKSHKLKLMVGMSYAAITTTTGTNNTYAG